MKSRVVINYVIRNIEPELWKEVKAQVATEGRSIRFVLLALLKVYAEHGYNVVEAFDGRNRKR